MALTPEQLKKLPPSVASLLRSQSLGDQQLPQQQNSSQAVLPGLQSAIGRRFGETQDFDPEYDAGLRGLMGQIPHLQSDFDKRRQRAGEEFTLTAEQLARQDEINRKRHLNAMANRGLGFSGANLVGQGRIQEGFQRGVQGANTAYVRGLDDLSSAEAQAYSNIQRRQAELEASAAERARIRDERRRWEQEQQKMEQERMQREEQLAQQQLAEQQRQNELFQQQLAALERQALAASQPMPTPTGTLAPPTSQNRNTDTNVSVNFQEYNLRDPNEVRLLQGFLGLRQDGVMGPQTWQALDNANAVYFDDRPIDPFTRKLGPDPWGGY